MDALELLKSRTSNPALRDPAPTPEQLEEMFQAALRAPDHGSLKPYRFLVIEGDAREKLGELFVAAGKAQSAPLDEVKEKKLATMPLRAPMIVTVIAVTEEIPKVPKVEQLMAAACAAQGIVLSAFAQGLGAMWRTGEMAYDPTVRQGLGVEEHEEIVGFVYLGRMLKVREAPESSTESFVTHWA